MHAAQDGLTITRNSLTMSRLGFGCAALGGRISRKDALSAMGTAFDAGVNLFDTARSYGFGQSEQIVGQFLRGRRDSVVVCTKFGILPAAQAGWKQKLKPAARSVLRLFPGLRKAAQRQIASQLVPGQFTVESLAASFEQSLRELGTDYVDLLIMHGAPRSALGQDDLLEAMGRLVEAGKVRVAGISGELPVIEVVFARRPPALGMAQFTLNLHNIAFVEETRLNRDLLLIGNQPFGGIGGADVIREQLDDAYASPELPADLREKLDTRDPQVLPEVVLHCILNGTGMSATITAMLQRRHIESNMRALHGCRFSTEDLVRLRQWFAGPSV